MDNFSLYITTVKFDQKIGSKGRPILVICYENNAIDFYPISSQFNKNIPTKKKYYYKIRDWKEAGLKKESYVDCHLKRTSMRALTNGPIGKLTNEDILGLSEFIEKINQ